MTINTLILACAIVFVASTGYSQQNDGPSKPKRPNIIFIFSDDHAYQAIGAYGGKLMPTPNIDRLAKNGTIFNNMLITNSICGPSRATLLTGKYSHKNGHKANEEAFNINQPVFSRLLQKSGYETAWVGKWHLGTLPNDAFDHWNILPGQGHYYNPDFINDKNDTVRIEGYVTNIITDLAKNFLENRDKEKPFFLVVGEKATHRQWQPDLQDLGAYDDITFPLPETFYDDYKGRFAAREQDMTIDKTMQLKGDLKVHLDEKTYSRFTPEQEKAFRAYYDGKISKEFDDKNLSGKALVEWKYQRYLKDYLATARSLDRNIGEIITYLEENGLAENTIIIYGSDQGFYLGEHGWFDKRFIYEESLRTPFIVQYPKGRKPGGAINELVLNIDWAPTFLDIAGINIPKDIQGKSFLPLLTSKSAPKGWRDAAYYHYYEFPQPHHVHPHFGIRTDRYKLVRFYGEKDFWELYDLQEDPNELKNQYSNKKYTKLLPVLKEKLKALINQYDDKEARDILARP